MRTRIYAMNTDGKDYMDECYAPYLTRSRKDESLKRQKLRDRQLCLASEVLLNRALELSDAGMAIPAVYSRNPYGKPYLPLHTGIHINWSHSGAWVICALSDREVGIDLQITGQEPKEALVRRILQPEELSFYRQAPVQQRKGLFYQYWTIKESFLKAAGTGFHMPLDTFYVCMEGEVPEIVQRSGEVPYVCQLLEFADADYTAALCLKGNRPVLADEARVEYL
ncbi:MAG: 4'-phosphopantetheinyl transferase superfamily protein [Lachnospiraceae bacterium]|nr:4'-phosphopantetheinyl transferase superfamily protein [Lachnospiraceae bacterium]